ESTLSAENGTACKSESLSRHYQARRICFVRLRTAYANQVHFSAISEPNYVAFEDISYANKSEFFSFLLRLSFDGQVKIRNRCDRFRYFRRLGSCENGCLAGSVECKASNHGTKSNHFCRRPT